MTTGPTQLVVLGFDRLDRFRGQVLDELRQIRGRDLIRLLDLLFSEAGLSAEGVRQVAGMLEPGTAAALLLVEHRWAARLAAAVADTGGRLLAQGFLTPDARIVLGEALDGVAAAGVLDPTVVEAALEDETPAGTEEA